MMDKRFMRLRSAARRGRWTQITRPSRLPPLASVNHVLLGQLDRDARVETAGFEVGDDRVGGEAELGRRAVLRVELEVDDRDEAVGRERGGELRRVRAAVAEVVPDV